MTSTIDPAGPSLRFVLADAVSADDLEAGLRAAAESRGLTLSPPGDQDEREDYHCRTWDFRPGDAYAQLIADGAIDTRWLSLCAPMTMLFQLQAKLSEHVAWIARDRLVAAAEKGGPRDLVRLALGTNALEDEAVEALLARGLKAEDTDMRAAAAEAIYLLHWPQLRQAVSDALALESDPGVKAMLEEIAGAGGR